MPCIQCGHENPNTAKFCNECGALVDRRKGERRRGDRRKSVTAGTSPPQEGVTSRRPSALPSLTPGTENAQGHYPATRAGESERQSARAFRGPASMPVEDARENGAPQRPPLVRSRESQGERISGPSFLGLANADSGGTSDYLLEEAPRSTWRAWLVLIILIIVGALFYLQWRTNWRANPHELPPPPAAPATPGPTAPQGNAAPPSDATGVPPAQTPQQATGTAPQEDKKLEGSKPPEPSAASNPSDAPAKAKKPADEEPNAADDANPPAEEETPSSSKSPREPIADRSSADPSHADPGRDPMLYMAQKYLRGGSAGRNCDQAMVYLKAANDRPSAPARSQMGALYATGTCVPMDRIRAYKWFTAALDVDPNNESLRRERTNLWAQMSTDERQQAVK